MRFGNCLCHLSWRIFVVYSVIVFECYMCFLSLWRLIKMKKKCVLVFLAVCSKKASIHTTHILIYKQNSNLDDKICFKKSFKKENLMFILFKKLHSICFNCFVGFFTVTFKTKYKRNILSRFNNLFFFFFYFLMNPTNILMEGQTDIKTIR